MLKKYTKVSLILFSFYKVINKICINRLDNYVFIWFYLKYSR